MQAPQVRPFRALRFDPARVDLADVVAPPYDVIDDRERAALAARSPYNAVHLILPREGHEEDANALFCRWRAEGVLILEDRPCFYWMQQDYTGPDGVPRSRGGFIAIVGLEPYDAGVIRPHERTRTAPKLGRLRLLRATRAQLSPVFALYHDAAGLVEAALRDGLPAEAEADVTDRDGTRHRLWRVPDHHQAVEAALAASPLLIADGHHRYEVALMYQQEVGAGPGDPASSTMVYLSNADAEGLVIFPTHRVIGGVDAAVRRRLPELLRAEGLDVRETDDPVGELAAADGRAAFAVLRDDDRALVAVGPDGTLDTELVQRGLLTPIGLDPAAVAGTGRIRYHHRLEDARAEVGGDTIAVIVRAPTVAEAERVAAEGRTMPQKSTYFFPKLLDGFVFYGLDDCG
jgi:uncharacterized protein (DUF1015 family)